MSRQRTIRDQNFWRSPRLLNCTTEDKVALLHLLTAPDSNITGVYPLVPRIAGAPKILIPRRSNRYPISAV
jgi:hypothetical protein